MPRADVNRFRRERDSRKVEALYFAGMTFAEALKFIRPKAKPSK